MKIQNFKTAANHYFNKTGMSQLIDNELGVRVKYNGYQDSEEVPAKSNIFNILADDIGYLVLRDYEEIN